MAVSKATLEQRLAQIQQAIEQSAANHNVLLGQKAEVQFHISQLFEAEIKEKQEAENASS